jgi:hypothetical protein
MALGVDLAPERNEYKEFFRKAGNITTICGPIVYRLWKPRRFTNQCASTPCYRDTFIFTYSVPVIYVTTFIDTC